MEIASALKIMQIAKKAAQEEENVKNKN